MSNAGERTPLTPSPSPAGGRGVTIVLDFVSCLSQFRIWLSVFCMIDRPRRRAAALCRADLDRGAQCHGAMIRPAIVRSKALVSPLALGPEGAEVA